MKQQVVVLALQAAASMLLLSACGTYPTKLRAFPRDQVVVVNGRGAMLEPRGNWCERRYTSLWEMSDEVPEDEEGRYATNVAERVASQLAAGRNVVIFFHGGLNTQVSTMKRAAQLLDYQEQHAETAPHFLLINWQSSLLSSYRDHLFYIREAKDYRLRSAWKQGLVALTSPLYLASDLLGGVARLPVTAERQAATMFNSMRFAPTEDVGMATDGFACVHTLTNVSPVADMGMSWRYALPSTLFGPLRILTVPVVDALGNPAWDVMQRRTSILFDREQLREQQACLRDPDVPLRGPLFKVGLALEERLAGRNFPGKLVLVGHSMGAIIGTELLRHFHGLRFDRVVFMAGACRVRDLAEGVFPYLAANPNAQFYNLVLHPQAETREANLFHVAPEGSLLVWLDQMLDKPDATPDRMAGRFVNLGMNAHYLEEEAQRLDPALPGRIFIKVFPYWSGHGAVVPMKHGDFGQFQFWEESFWRLDRSGPYGSYLERQ